MSSSSEKIKALWATPEYRNKTMASMKKKVLSEEHKKKISKSESGEKNHNYGKKLSEKEKIKMKLYEPKSEEHKQKLREYRLGRKASEETKEKYRKRKQELAKDPEYRKRLSEGVRKALKSDPTINERRSESSKKRWQDPLYRQGLSYKHQSNWDNDTERKQALVERNVGGFWYGSVPYYENPQYCEMWTPELRERVRAYFGYVCVECGTPQNGRKLGVHHVHYNKKTCCDGSPRDLVPLCAECHSATNHNREYWEQHFSDMLYGYYGGKSFFTKEEMKAYKKLKESP